MFLSAFFMRSMMYYVMEKVFLFFGGGVIDYVTFYDVKLVTLFGTQR